MTFYKKYKTLIILNLVSMQIVFPALVKNHYVTYVLNMLDQTKDYLTSLPGYTRTNKSRRVSEFELLGDWLMKEAMSFMKRLFKYRKQESLYYFPYYGWRSPHVPIQPDGAS